MPQEEEAAWGQALLVGGSGPAACQLGNWTNPLNSLGFILLTCKNENVLIDHP